MRKVVEWILEAKEICALMGSHGFNTWQVPRSRTPANGTSEQRQSAYLTASPWQGMTSRLGVELGEFRWRRRMGDPCDQSWE